MLHEPAFGTALDWLLCDALGHVAGRAAETTPDLLAAETAHYFRLTTRTIDQSPFEDARQRIGDAVLRRQVLAGAYRLIDGRTRLSGAFGPADDEVAPTVHLVASGAVLPEVLAAARELADEGVIAHVVDVTSPGRLYRSWQRTIRQAVRTATTPSLPGTLRAALPDRAPIVSVQRRVLARPGLAGLGAGRPPGLPGRRHLRAVRHHRRPLPGPRHRRRLDRQRRHRGVESRWGTVTLKERQTGSHRAVRGKPMRPRSSPNADGAEFCWLG